MTPFLPSLSLSPEEKYGREVRVIPVDFTDGQDIYPQIEEELKDLDIGILGESWAEICAIHIYSQFINVSC